MRALHTLWIGAAAAVAWSFSSASCTSSSSSSPGQACFPAPDIAVDVVPSPPASDGSVTVYGTVRFAPLVRASGAGGSTATSGSAGAGGGGPHEQAVNDVIVAGAPVTSTDFNFRSWWVNISKDRLCAYAMSPEAASLPVRAYVSNPSGVCSFDAEPVSVTLLASTCNLSGGGASSTSSSTSSSSSGSSSSSADGSGGSGGGSSSAGSG